MGQIGGVRGRYFHHSGDVDVVCLSSDCMCSGILERLQALRACSWGSDVRDLTDNDGMRR